MYPQNQLSLKKWALIQYLIINNIIYIILFYFHGETYYFPIVNKYNYQNYKKKKKNLLQFHLSSEMNIAMLNKQCVKLSIFTDTY